MDDRSQRLPSAAEIAEINAKHLIQTPLRLADLLFVFGTREDVELRAEDLRRAAQALGRLVGAIAVEEVLDQVFARFCIGK